MEYFFAKHDRMTAFLITLFEILNPTLQKLGKYLVSLFTFLSNVSVCDHFAAPSGDYRLIKLLREKLLKTFWRILKNQWYNVFFFSKNIKSFLFLRLRNIQSLWCHEIFKFSAMIIFLVVFVLLKFHLLP